MTNSLEIKDSIAQLVAESRALIDLAKTEERELTEEENTRLDAIKSDIEARKAELASLEKELEKETKEERTQKNISHNIMKKTTLVQELRNALENNEKTIKMNAETRTMTVQGEDGIHDEVVETEIQGILEPLYANSVLEKLGVRWYTGLPMGDIQVPIMGKSNVGWQSEIGAATATGNEFTTKRLSPKRLTAYVDISKQLIYQDTIGVEAAIRRDIVNALRDKLEATVLGTANKTDVKPAGIFYGAELAVVDDYAKLCEFESDIEDANVDGEFKYLLSPKAKAAFRSMIKGTNATGMVFEGGDVDGTPAVVTTNVGGKTFVYGNWNYLAIGSWGDIDITLDEYTQAVNGCIRLVINAFFDAVILRPEAFVYGKTEE